MSIVNIIAIGIIIINTIIFFKFKPTYTVYLDGENIGYISQKCEFEEQLEKNLYNNKEENIAFIESDIQIQYTLIDRKAKIDEEQLLEEIKEKSNIIYFEYAVVVNGIEKTHLKTEESAKKLADTIRNEVGEKNNITIQTIYTNKLEKSDEEISQNKIIQEIKEEKRKEEATIDGIYLAVTPVSGTITSRYGAREDIRSKEHKGLDIGAKPGTPIKAVADGKVKYSNTMGGYGNIVIIEHGNGIETYYGHCSKLYAEVGCNVKAGEVIAEVGSTGNSTGPHLHFEIRQNGEYVNPQKYLYN